MKKVNKRIYKQTTVFLLIIFISLLFVCTSLAQTAQGKLKTTLITDSVDNLPILKTDFLKLAQTSDICEKAKPFLPKEDSLMIRETQRIDKSPKIVPSSRKGKSLLSFSYFGTAKDVEIVGDFTAWKPCNLKLNQSDKSKILFLEFPNTARVEYKLIVDGKWITDPLNPDKVDNGVGGENSFFTMPDYKPTIWDNGEVPKLETLEIDSKIYGEKRKIQIYVPNQIKAQLQEYPANQPSSYYKNKPITAANTRVLYLQDGSDYINRAHAVQIQQNLVKDKRIKPFIMVFIDYKDRMKEYWANDDYAKYLATEIVPLIDAKYLITGIGARENRAVMGASLGGITAVNAGLKYPEIFGRIGGQSTSFWIDNERIVKELETLDSSKNKFKFYFDDGIIEGAEDSRKVVKLLKEKGYQIVYKESEAGHNWTAWGDRLADAFIGLWQ